MKLNDTKLRRITAQGQRIDLSDGNGLVLRVSPNGQKRWSVRYRFAHKQARIEIGTYPDVSLAQARARLYEIKGLLASGCDPALTFKTPEVLKVGDVYFTWLENFCRDHYTPSTYRAIQSTFTLHILPSWQGRDLRALRAADLFQLLTQAAQRNGRIGGPGAARDVKKHLNKMAKWARAQGLIDVNYFADVQAPYKYVERSRTPTLKEARQIFARLTECGTYPFGSFYRLLLLTGLRRKELALSEWSWLTQDALVIPREATKAKRMPHAVPLTRQMRAFIAKLPRMGPHLFTSNGLSPLSGWTKALQKVRGYCDVPHFTPHDFRRAMATEMDRMRVPDTIIELCLGHTQPQLKRAYRTYSFFDEKKAALQKWNNAVSAPLTIPRAGHHEP